MKLLIILISVIAFLVSCKNMERKYYESGELLSEIEHRGGVPNGEAKIYFKTGDLKIETHYIDNEIDGKYVQYDEDGKVERICHYSRGQLHGLEEWYEEGKLMQKGNYIKGVLEGEMIEYYPTGDVKAIGEYVNGQQHGLTTFYYKSGTKSSQTNFKRGLKHGVYRSYHSNGELIMDALLENESTVYYAKFDSIGDKVGEFWQVIIEGPDKIELGSTYEATIRLPGPKENKEVFIDFYDENLWADGNVSVSYEVIRADQTKEELENRKFKLRIQKNVGGETEWIEEVTGTPVPIIEKKGHFEYTPKQAGRYVLKGSLSLIYKKGEIDILKSFPITISFEVTSNSTS